MIRLTTAKLDWFDDGCCDVKYLDRWQKLPVNYRLGQAVDASWFVDHHELLLGRDARGALFRDVADRVMRYHFYPPDVLAFVSDFSLQDRWLKVGDRIVQRIYLLTILGKHVLDVVSMTEVRAVIDEPRRRGFTYVTTASHVEQGEWSLLAEWTADNDVRLSLHAISRPCPDEPARNSPLIRAYQRRAHRRGLEHFRKSLAAGRQVQFGV